MSGSTYYVTSTMAWGLVVLMGLLLALSWPLGRWLDLLPLGSTAASSFGLDLTRSRLLILLLAAPFDRRRDPAGRPRQLHWFAGASFGSSSRAVSGAGATAGRCGLRHGGHVAGRTGPGGAVIPRSDPGGVDGLAARRHLFFVQLVAARLMAMEELR